MWLPDADRHDRLAGGGIKLRATEEIGAFALAADGRITLISPVTEALSGYRLDDVRGRFYSEFVLPEDLALATETFGSALRGEKREVEISVTAQGGSVLRLHVVVLPDTRDDHEVIGVVGTVHLVEST